MRVTHFIFCGMMGMIFQLDKIISFSKSHISIFFLFMTQVENKFSQNIFDMTGACHNGF